MKLHEILELEGLVIRKIPKESTTYWATSDKAVEEHKKHGGKTVVNERGRELIVEHKVNSLGGLYLVCRQQGQDSITRFNLKTCGKGKTIEEAYKDYITKP